MIAYAKASPAIDEWPRFLARTLVEDPALVDCVAGMIRQSQFYRQAADAFQAGADRQTVRALLLRALTDEFGS